MSAVLLASGAMLLLMLRPDREGANREQYAVYSGYIREGLTGESHSLGDPRGLVAILASSAVTAEQPAGLQRLRNLLFACATLRHREPSIPLPLLGGYVCSNLRSERFERRFAFGGRYAFLESADDYFTRAGQDRFPASYGFLSLSLVAFNRGRSEAFFYAEHICGLCGGGEFVWMRKSGGAWRMVARYGTWIS